MTTPLRHEPPDGQRGMPWAEAVALAEEIRSTPHYRVYTLADRSFYPENWRIGVVYRPLRPDGRVLGHRYSRYVTSRADWHRFQDEAVAANQHYKRRT